MLKKNTYTISDLVGKGFNIAQHNAVVAFKKTNSICELCFLGAVHLPAMDIYKVNCDYTQLNCYSYV